MRFFLFPLVVILFATIFMPRYSLASNLSSQYLYVLNLESEGRFDDAIKVLDEMLKIEQNETLYEKYIYLHIYVDRVQKAIDISLKAEKLYPKSTIFIKLLAQLYEIQGDYDKTLLYLDRLISMEGSGSTSEYLFAKAMVLDKLDKKSKSIGILSDLLKLDEISIYYSNRGRIYQELGKTKLAIKDYEQAVDIDGNIFALLKLADYYLQNSDNDKAEKYLEILVSKGETLILPEIKLGEIYMQRDDYQKAIELYSSLATKLSGKDRVAVLKYLGDIQYKAGDYDNATVTFEWISELLPEDTMSSYIAGYFNEFTGNKERALEIYNKSLELNPTYPSILKRVAIIYLMDNNTDKAIANLSKIDEIEKDIDYYRLMAESYSIQKDHNKSITVLLDGLNNNPTSDEILYSLAVEYEKMKDNDKSIKYIRQAYEIDPTNGVYQNFLGYSYAVKGIKLDEAYELVKSALEKEPNNAAYLDSLGWVYYKKKDYESAYEYVKRAVELAPNEKEIKDHFDEIKKQLKLK